MGYQKEMMLQREGMISTAEDVAIAAGLGTRCEFHSTFISEFPDEDLLVEAYKIANAQVSTHKIELPSTMSRRDFTDLIKETVEQAPSECPECDRHLNSKD